MPHINTDRLRGIKTLPQLAAYLRDELDWPIESEDTEEFTFEYDAAERLGRLWRLNFVR